MLDMSRVLAGPYCGMILTDLGVDTIKIEVPEKGDDARHYPPFVDGESVYYVSLNRNKKSLTLNLKSAEGKKIFLELVAISDIVLENFRPGTMDKLGLGYDILEKVNPSIIYAACSGYGYTGPYSSRPAYDIIVQAMGGIMSLTGPDEKHFYRVGTSIGDVVAGMYTAIGILAALNHRNKTGKGQMVDVAMLDCQLSILENAVSRYFATGKDPKPIGNYHQSISPFGEVVTKDGTMMVAAGNDVLFRKLCELIGRGVLADDDRFRSNDLRVANLKELINELNKIFMNKNTYEWMEILNNGGIPCSPVNRISQIVKDPQIIERDMIIETINSKGSRVKIPGNPLKFSKTKCKVENAAPLLGEHTKEVLCKYLGYSDNEIEMLYRNNVV